MKLSSNLCNNTNNSLNTIADQEDAPDLSFANLARQATAELAIVLNRSGFPSNPSSEECLGLILEACQAKEKLAPEVRAQVVVCLQTIQRGVGEWLSMEHRTGSNLADELQGAIRHYKGPDRLSGMRGHHLDRIVSFLDHSDAIRMGALNKRLHQQMLQQTKASKLAMRVEARLAQLLPKKNWPLINAFVRSTLVGIDSLPPNVRRAPLTSLLENTSGFGPLIGSLGTPLIDSITELPVEEQPALLAWLLKPTVERSLNGWFDGINALLQACGYEPLKPNREDPSTWFDGFNRLMLRHASVVGAQLAPALEYLFHPMLGRVEWGQEAGEQQMPSERRPQERKKPQSLYFEVALNAVDGLCARHRASPLHSLAAWCDRICNEPAEEDQAVFHRFLAMCRELPVNMQATPLDHVVKAVNFFGECGQDSFAAILKFLPDLPAEARVSLLGEMACKLWHGQGGESVLDLLFEACELLSPEELAEVVNQTLTSRDGGNPSMVPRFLKIFHATCEALPSKKKVEMLLCLINATNTTMGHHLPVVFNAVVDMAAGMDGVRSKSKVLFLLVDQMAIIVEDDRRGTDPLKDWYQSLTGTCNRLQEALQALPPTVKDKELIGERLQLVKQWLEEGAGG